MNVEKRRLINRFWFCFLLKSIMMKFYVMFVTYGSLVIRKVMVI